MTCTDGRAGLVSISGTNGNAAVLDRETRATGATPNQAAATLPPAGDLAPVGSFFGDALQSELLCLAEIELERNRHILARLRDQLFTLHERIASGEPGLMPEAILVTRAVVEASDPVVDAHEV